MSQQAQSPVEQAKGLMGQRQYQDAIGLLQPWLTDHPDDASAWAALGAAHFEVENWSEAEKAAREVVRLRPDSARDWCNLGVIRRKLGQVHKAAQAQRRAVRLDPEHHRARRELSKLRRVHTPAKVEPWPLQGSSPRGSESVPGCIGNAGRKASTLALTAAALALIVVGGVCVIVFALLHARTSEREQTHQEGPAVSAGPAAKEQPSAASPPAASAPQRTARRPRPSAPSTATAPSSRTAQAEPAARETPSAHWSAGAAPSPSQGKPARREGSIPRPTSNLHGEALDAIKDLQTAVDVGVSYRDYRSYLISAKQKLRRLESKVPTNSVWWQEITAAMTHYEMASTAWDWKFSGDGVSQFVADNGPLYKTAVTLYRGKLPKVCFLHVDAEPGLWREHWELNVDCIIQAAWQTASEHITNAERAGR